MSKAFKAYGFELKDPETQVELETPETYKATFDYQLNDSTI